MLQAVGYVMKNLLKMMERKIIKVKNQCHFTGKFRGAAHNLCNLKYKKPKFTPVLFHNLSGYDAHFLIKNLGGIEGNINCIPNTDERDISLTKNVSAGEYTDKKGKTKKEKTRYISPNKICRYL